VRAVNSLTHTNRLTERLIVRTRCP